MFPEVLKAAGQGMGSLGMSLFARFYLSFSAFLFLFFFLVSSASAAETTGAISGTVVDAESGEPLVNILVTAYGRNGSFEGRVRTASDCSCALTGLEEDGYHILLSDTGDHNAQVYGGGECVIGCGIFQGGVIDVVAEQTTSGIDFALERGGSISGEVKAVHTGLPLGGHQIRIYAEGGESVSVQSYSAYSDGSYVISGLPAGDYFVVATGAGDYIGQYYGGSPCLGWCSRPSGTLVTVAQEQTASDVDIVLTKGGVIQGVVHAAEDGAPAGNVQVSVLDISGNTVGTAFTDALGQYRVGGLLTGDYYVRFADEIGWSGVAYGGTPCPGYGCDLTFATAVDVTLGQTAGGINFIMPIFGAIAGTLRDEASGLGLAHEIIEVYSWDGRLSGVAMTDELGAYHFDGLLPGSYFVAGPVDSDYIRTIYGGPDCFGVWTCMLVLAASVEVLQDQETSGIDLVSRKGGVISGVVTDADTGKPVSNVYVTAYGRSGTRAGSASTDDQGVYRIIGLPSDSYALLASDQELYRTQAYGDYACSGCDIELVREAGITVKAGQDVTGIDFALNAKHHPDTGISGIVRAADTGLPLKDIYVWIMDADGFSVSGVLTDRDGHYEVELPRGDYYVQVQRSGGYVGERYDGEVCPNHSCDTVAGTLITVAAGQLVTGINFSLIKGGVISGTVTGVDGKYLGEFGPNAPYVEIVDAHGMHVAAGSIDAAGNYRISGLPAGQYVMRAYYGFHYGGGYTIPRLYSGKIYGGKDCAGRCANVTSGIAVQVANGASVPGIDFTLQRAGVISGTVSAADTGEPLAHARVEVYDGNSELLFSGVANAQGEYRLKGLATGQYYVKAAPLVRRQDGYVYSAPLPHAGDYMAGLFGGLPCVNLCDVTRGESVSVTIGETSANVDVVLSRGDGISGKVVDGKTGVGVPYVLLSIFDSVGTWVGFQGWTDASGEYRISGLSPGRYYLLALGTGKYDNQLFDRLPCASEECVITSGTAVEIVRGTESAGIDFVLGDVVEEQPLDVAPVDSGGGSIAWQLLLLLLCWEFYCHAAYRLRRRRRV